MLVVIIGTVRSLCHQLHREISCSSDLLGFCTNDTLTATGDSGLSFNDT